MIGLHMTGRVSRTGLSVLAAVALVASAFAPAVLAASPGSSANHTTITRMAQLGTAHLTSGTLAPALKANSLSAAGSSTLEFPTQAIDDFSPKIVDGPAVVNPPTSGPTPRPNRVASSNPETTGFNGLTHADQRNAGTGAYLNTQFSLEPPDQGLCVGNGDVVEAINNALEIYSTSGATRAGPTALSQFFNLAPEINRTTGVAGAFISDPKCIYDAQTNRFFLTELMEDTGGNAGATGRFFQLIAVSESGDPTGAWNLYRFDTTDDGLMGTPNDPGCPCFGDQPLIGADANGVYISTNEFGAGFNGAQIYAMSKWALAAGASSIAVVHLQGGALAEGISYSVQPATTPNRFYATQNGGTEYFLSALQFAGSYDNRIAVWSLTNTSSLKGSSPNLTLSHVVIGSEVYGQPNPATQKAGPTPLGTSLGEPLETLNTNDDRMNQVVYANGQLWGALNTAIGATGDRAGIAYFDVIPYTFHGRLGAFMLGQSYVSLAHDNVLFPSIGVNSWGQAIMGFSVSGPDYYPSAGYTEISPWSAGSIHITGVGTAPEDGFSGYPEYAGAPGTVARWGDYSATVVDASGRFWTAAEYIPNSPRTMLANWGTYITSVEP